MSSPALKITIHQLGLQRARVLEAGQPGAPAVLLIHGGLGDAQLHWDTTLAALGTSYHVYAPDLPGFHDGSDALQNPSIPHMVAWMEALLHELRIERVFLVGTSVGGLLARFYAAAYPARVERLVLVDGGLVPPIPGIVRSLLKVPGIAHAFFRYTYRRIYSPQALQRAIHQHDLLTESFFQRVTRASRGYMPLFRAILAERWPGQQTPSCPTLIVWGQEDRLAPPAEGRKLLQILPQTELVLVEQAGHLPMLEQPEIFLAAISAFFKKHRTACASEGETL